MSLIKTDNIKLAKRAVACKGWRWLPGMRCIHRWTGGIRVLTNEEGEQSEAYVVLPDGDGNAVCCIDECGIMGEFPNSTYPFVPDLTDPATLGCLLALVREAWGVATLSAIPDGDRWFVEDGACDLTIAGEDKCGWSTEAEALVAALEGKK